MKKIVAGMTVASLFIFTGCGKNNPEPESQTQQYNEQYNSVEQCKINGDVAPDWVCNSGANMEGGLFAVGSAPKSPLGINFQRNEAISHARDELARQMKVKVKNMIKTYMSSTGIGDNQTAERVATQVSKQLTSQVLHGSKLLKTWMGSDGTMYVLVGMKQSIRGNVKNAVTTTLHNDQALWQEFKAKKAQEELDAAIDKEFK